MPRTRHGSPRDRSFVHACRAAIVSLRRLPRESLAMITRLKWLLVVVVLLLIAAIGLRKDIDYCQLTAQSRSALSLWGIKIHSKDRDGYRPWLEEEIGVKLGSDFVDYQRFNPLFPTRSTPPGNWLFLTRAKEVYDQCPAGRAEIKSMIQRQQGVSEPILGGRAGHRLNEIQKSAEQDAGHKRQRPVTPPASLRS